MLSRRTFLKSAAPLLVPASVYRAATAAEKPSERVRVAMIGVGNQGGPKNNMKYFLKNIVAVCDVDKDYLAASGEFLTKNGQAAPVAYDDYRKVLDAKDVDAVVVTVPDQWHCLMTVHACKAGKDVYCEKPLSLVIKEGRTMVEAARKHERVVNTGSMQRSGKEFLAAVDLVRKGAVGKVKEVKVGLPKPNWIEKAEGKAPVPDSAPPKALNYDTWLGPAPERPYNKNRVHYLFRFFWDYSGGQQTNFGAHHLDIAQWALGMDESGPVAVEGTAVYHPQMWYETPDSTEITYTYANGVTMRCGQKYEQGAMFVGDKGTLFVGRGKLKADPADILKGVDVDLKAASGGASNVAHVNNFLDCVKTRKRPNADVEIGHRSATVCHLGNIAVRSGQKITWDPAAETIGGVDAAKWLTKEYRKGYSL